MSRLLVSPTNNMEEEQQAPNADAGLLSLEADEESMARQLRKRGPQLRTDELEALLGKMHDMKRAYDDAKAAYDARTAKYNKNMTMFSGMWDRPFDVEYGIAKQFLQEGITVWNALRLGTILRSVSEVLKRDDALWKRWFLADFPELVRDIGPDLPGWIEHGTRAKEDSRYALVPWRRYYAWSKFFRRAALREIATLQNELAVTWISDEGWKWNNVKRWPLNVEIEMGVEWKALVLEPPPAVGAHYMGFAELALETADKDETYFFPERMFLHSGGIATPYGRDDIDGDHPLIANARSPVYWLVRYAANRPEHAKNRLHVWFEGLKITEQPTLPQWPSHYSDPNTSNSPIKVVGDLNFDYGRTLHRYCLWYCKAYKRDEAGGLPVHSERTREILDHDASHDDQTTAVALLDLPPAPMVGGVWFVRSPACVGCDVSVEPTHRCRRCGRGYCSVECHTVNWKKACADCVKK